MDAQGQNGEITQIMLIDGPQQRLQPLFQALRARAGYQVRLWSDTMVDLSHLATTDVLLLDEAVANQPKSSQFVDAPLILVLTGNGRVTGLEVMECLSVRDEDGTFNPQLGECALPEPMDADMVIVAVGQAVDMDALPKGFHTNGAGTVKVHPLTFQTDDPLAHGNRLFPLPGDDRTETIGDVDHLHHW